MNRDKVASLIDQVMTFRTEIRIELCALAAQTDMRLASAVERALKDNCALREHYSLLHSENEKIRILFDLWLDTTDQLVQLLGMQGE
jgi:hypothetical protein